ncbi:MAG: aminoacyl-tRNA hydrolase [Thiobacillaceae bacterium]|jgi:PTH1 family peptidyl-tRNA hydrolase
MAALRLIAGLGNPGPDYSETRHNAGFWFVDACARKMGITLAPESRFFGEVGRIKHHGQDVWLLKPLAFMNRSGRSVAALAHFYKINPEEILVVHDELDLLPGEVRLKQGGGNGGHNGLKDIEAQLGSKDFWRLRLGIGHPRSLSLTQDVVDFVLHRPRQHEQEAIAIALARCLDELPSLTTGDFPAAMQRLHTKAQE